ncbi:MAG: aminotransferase class V-fold PLP-dependent enzyme, partial [Planctomycetota bacterium]
NVVNPMQWEDIDFTLQDTARRYEYGSPALAPIIAVGTGLSMLDRVGIENTFAQIQQLNAQFVDSIQQLGYHVVSPAEADERGGAVCFLPPDRSETTAKAIYQKLSEQNCELASRCGRMRFSPHFYNTPEQVEHCVDLLRKAL